jgi:pyruvate/2-oxoglutarate dehydrogenase complex dihydrolipoamide acyltransferase (E2) component
MIEIRLPQWGMEMTDGVILSWLKHPGDKVAEGEEIAEVETAKVTAMLEAPAGGTIVELLVQAGMTAQVFDVLALLEEES